MTCLVTSARHRMWNAPGVVAGTASSPQEVLSRLSTLRQNRYRGRRAPHKPLLALLALGRLTATGSSALPWSEAEQQLGGLIKEFGPPSETSASQSAAYPFTRLRGDKIWVLNQDVPMDRVKPLADHEVTGRLDPSLEEALRQDPELLQSVARTLVNSHFPPTVAPDVLTTVGLDPDVVLRIASEAGPDTAVRRRIPGWRTAVLQAWNRQCAFCGYDGQLGTAPVGIEAAHVRWFGFDGPDALDNGLALCVLHHKLFDLGAMGLDQELRVQVSAAFTARTPVGQAQYDLHGRHLTPRRGTPTPATEHIQWHRSEVFKGEALIA